MSAPLVTGFAAGKGDQVTDSASGVPHLRPTNILPDDGISFDETKFVPASSIGPADHIVVGEVLFNNTNSTAWVGKSALFEGREGGPTTCSNHITRIRPRADVPGAFLVAVLHMLQRAGYFGRLATNFNNQAGINAETLAEVVIPLGGEGIRKSALAALDAARERRKKMLVDADALIAGLDGFLLDQLGLTLPAPDADGRNCWGVRLAETLSERRLDPHRYAPRTRKLRQMITGGKFRTLELAELIGEPVSGNWGVAAEDREKDVEYVECLVIRATEFDNVENLILDNDRVRFRFLERERFDSLSLLDGDLILEKSGGGPLQPVGRVAIIEPEHLSGRNLSFTNFVMRLRPNREVLPVYLWAFLGLVNRCGLTESMQAQTHGIRNLKLDEYLSQPVPVPDDYVQTNIAAEVARRREKARKLRADAAALSEQAKADFEAALLGPVT